ncbi:DUF3025 domain-containing protein [Limnohabitans sp. DM1]|uniref:DUF3025 domain-containing protein n=1 Tax=Limnohabitans sp. DM1 TaxID=1597955 RepID=UPI001E5062BB|nr:DUF3025 domain-containing protein [Limnohabitans sp. DM1]
MSDIDWDAPWLADWRAVGEPIARQVAAGVPQPEALNAAGRAPVCFVPQADLPEGQAYEDFIFATGQVPTREGLHDFFNALCWMQFPLAKKRLNQLQASEIARAGVGQVRGPVRDAATVFDENALLIQPSNALWAALTEHRWQDALLGLRHEWAHTRLWVFGHAALEKLVQPYKSITVHLWRVPQTVAPADIDTWLAQDLSPDKLATKPFSPLPVLGVPGWWSANAAPAFYDDAEVFRPRRVRAQVKKPYANADIVPSA